MTRTPTRLTLSLLLLALLPAAGAQDGSGPGPDPARFQAARARLLAEVERVEGRAVGFAGEPGAFWVVCQELARAGRSEDFAALLREEGVVARAAGLVCLVQTDPAAAVRALEARLDSRARVELITGGCCVETISEGELAARLAFDANLLEAAPPRPLVQAPLSEGEPAARRFRWARAALALEAPRLAVSGAHVGRGAAPGRFYLLVRELAATGEEAALGALVRDEQVVVRAAGLVALRRRFPAAATKALESRRGSEAKLEFMPGGCEVEVISEGQLAERLLADPQLLQ